MKLSVLFFYLFLSNVVMASSFDFTGFINQVKKNSLIYQNYNLEGLSQNVEDQLELHDFDYKGQASYNYFNADEVNFSPFSPEKIKKSTYNLSLDKTWASGLSTNLNYSLEDNFTNYPSRPKLEYLLPDLSLSLKSNIINDIFYQSQNLKYQKIDSKLKLNQLSLNEKKKTLILKALLKFSESIKVDKQITSQLAMCKNLKSQVNKLYQKSKIGAINKRDYYFSLKKKNNCEIQVVSLSSKKRDLKTELEVDYGLNTKGMSVLSLDAISQKLFEEFNKYSDSSKTVNLENTTQFKLLKQQKEYLAFKKKQMQAENALPLNVELKVGVKGLDDSIENSHERMFDLNNPYVSGTVYLDFPFKNKKKSNSIKSINYQYELANKKINLLQQQQKQNFLNLKENINNDFKNLKFLQKNITYSKSALSLAKKDFNNGRIDFLNLSDYQSSLIESEVQKYDLQLNVIVNIVNYLDYNQYFDRYF